MRYVASIDGCISCLTPPRFVLFCFSYATPLYQVVNRAKIWLFFVEVYIAMCFNHDVYLAVFLIILSDFIFFPEYSCRSSFWSLSCDHGLIFFSRVGVRTTTTSSKLQTRFGRQSSWELELAHVYCYERGVAVCVSPRRPYGPPTLTALDNYVRRCP